MTDVIHEMKLNPAPFEMIKSGIKTIEMRLYDEKRSKIRVGDFIRFTKVDKDDTITVRVKALHRFANFRELYAALPLTKCGYTEADIATASPDDMELYYSADEQAKYGVVGIEVELIKEGA